MRKLILVVGLTVINLQGLGTLPRPTGESVRSRPTGPFTVGQQRRSTPGYLWDQRDSPRTLPVPVRRPLPAPR